MLTTKCANIKRVDGNDKIRLNKSFQKIGFPLVTSEPSAYKTATITECKKNRMSMLVLDDKSGSNNVVDDLYIRKMCIKDVPPNVRIGFGWFSTFSTAQTLVSV